MKVIHENETRVRRVRSSIHGLPAGASHEESSCMRNTIMSTALSSPRFSASFSWHLRRRRSGSTYGSHFIASA